MRLKKILLILLTILLCSACSLKDGFYREAYNFIQNNSIENKDFCRNETECAYKRLHAYEYNQDKKMSYDEYKKSIQEESY